MKPLPWPEVRGVPLHPLADVGLPLLLNAQVALAVGLTVAGVSAVAGRPLLPGLGWWAFLLAVEGFLFEGYFYVREVDRPLLLRGVEAALVLLLSKLIATVPATGLGLEALREFAAIEPWVGVPLLMLAWYGGLKAADLCGALHPGLMPDPGGERVMADPHGEAFDALRARVLGLTGLLTLLLGLLPVLGAAADLRWPISWRAVLAGLIGLAALAALSLALAARLRQEIDWRLEGLTPPPDVLARWLPQALSLLLLPLLMAALVPAGPRLPVERLIPRFELAEVEFYPEAPPAEGTEWQPLPGLEELLDQWGVEPVTIPPWVPALLKAVLTLAALLLAAQVARIAWRQAAERAGGFPLLPLLRALARLYLALLQALWSGLRGTAALAGRGAAEVARGLLAGSGELGRRLPVWGRPPGEPRAAVRWYFRRLMDDARRRGVQPGRAATAGEFGRALAEAVPDEAEAVAGMVEVYQQVRYGPGPASGGQVERSRQLWRRIHQALGRGKPS